MLAFVYFGAVLTLIVCTESADYKLTLDPNGKYNLSWSYTGREPTDEITFTVDVETSGWIGLGFSPNGGMKDADLIVGWVDSEGQGHLEDRHSTVNGFPPLDDNDHVTLLSSREVNGKTQMTFKRKLNTCDKDGDNEIKTDTTRLIYAYGPNDPANNQFAANDKHSVDHRGAKSIYLLDPAPSKTSVPDDVMYHDMTVSNLQVPDADTTYHCSFHSPPDIDQKHHVVALEVLVTPGNEGLVHHVVLYACWDVSRMHMVNSPKKEGLCFSPEMPEYMSSCHATIFAWVVGGAKFYYPENAGYSIGSKDGKSPEFFMVEIHYDNPLEESGRIDSSGIRLSYTPTLRDMDIGNLRMGDIDGIFVPPKLPAFRTSGYCHGSCTQQWIPKEGITVFGYMLHAHLLGTAIQVDLYRDGKPKEIFAVDKTYDFNFQENRLFPEPKKLYPGDSLKVTCTLNSLGRDAVVYGGNSSFDEMCLAFLMYYPRQEISRCKSFPAYLEKPDDKAYSIFNVAADRDETKYGRLNIQDAFNGIQWNDDLKAKAQEIVDTSTLYSRCEKSGVETHTNHYQTFEATDFKPYLVEEEPDLCLNAASNDRTKPLRSFILSASVCIMTLLAWH